MIKPLQPPCGRGNAIPLWWLAPPPFPRKRGHYKAPRSHVLISRSTFKSLYFKHGLFCSRLRGKSGAAGKGEASAASQSAECLSCHMTQKDKSRNAGFISIAAERQSTTLGPKGRQTYEPSGPKGPVHLKNLFPPPFEPSEPGPLRGPNKKNNKCILHFSFKCDTIRTTVKEKVYYCGGIQ